MGIVEINKVWGIGALAEFLADKVDGTIVSDAGHWASNSRERSALMRSEDAREGPRAFAEKRAPVWKAK